jgi:hypothetical protein
MKYQEDLDMCQKLESIKDFMHKHKESIKCISGKGAKSQDTVKAVKDLNALLKLINDFRKDPQRRKLHMIESFNKDASIEVVKALAEDEFCHVRGEIACFLRTKRSDNILTMDRINILYWMYVSEYTDSKNRHRRAIKEKDVDVKEAIIESLALLGKRTKTEDIAAAILMDIYDMESEGKIKRFIKENADNIV